MLSPLAKLVMQKTGLTMTEFVEQHLNSKYKTWQMRQRKKMYYPAEVVYICWILGVSCEQAFGYPYSKLVMFQGKYGIPEKLQNIWKGADLPQKNKLLGLLGLAELRDPKVKLVAAEKKKAPEPIIDFLLEVDAPKEEEPLQASGAPEGQGRAGNDPLKDLFIETY